MTGASAIEPGFGEQMKDAIHLYDVFIPAFTFDTTTILKLRQLIIEDIQ